MKYIPIILAALMFVSCTNPIRQRDIAVANSIKSYLDTLFRSSSGHSKPAGKIDSIKTISIDSISDSKHLEMVVNGLQTIQLVGVKSLRDSVKRSAHFHKYQNEIDSVNTIKTSNQFWGYHVKAKIYSHGFNVSNAEDNEMFFFVNKEYNADVDTKDLFEHFNTN